MTFPGRRTTSDACPKLPRPLRGGPIPVSEDDLPFYAALVGRAPNADDRMAVLLSGFELNHDDERAVNPWGWRRMVGRVKKMLSTSFRRTGRVGHSGDSA
jgi:hypothetical protein